MWEFRGSRDRHTDVHLHSYFKVYMRSGYFTAEEEPNSHGLNIDTEAKQSSQYVCAGERLQV